MTAAPSAADSKPPVLLIMGVSGSGKSTVAKPLAAELGWDFKEGDDLHPPANIAKMKAGEPLTDADRGPWLDAIGQWIDGQIARGAGGVVTCSALRRAYRDRLRAGRPQLRIVYLAGSFDLIAGRLKARKGHFMPPSLLASQFDTLEAPTPDEHVIEIDIDKSVTDQVAAIREVIGAG